VFQNAQHFHIAIRRVRQEKKAIYDGNFFVSRKHWEETNGTLKFVVDFQQVQVLPIQSP